MLKGDVIMNTERNIRLTDELDSTINIVDVDSITTDTECEASLIICWRNGETKRYYYGHRLEDMRYDAFKIATIIRNINVWDLLS